MLQQNFNKAVQSGDAKKVIAAADAAIEYNAMFERFVCHMKFAALVKLDEQDKALDYGKKLMASELGKNPQILNAIAWAVVDPDSKTKPNAKLLALAVEGGKKADELAKEKDAVIAETLAMAYFDSGELTKAVETQEAHGQAGQGHAARAEQRDGRAAREIQEGGRQGQSLNARLSKRTPRPRCSN